VKRFANCAVVVDAGVGTGSSCRPAVSARRWSIPTRKTAPVICAPVIDNTNSAADTHRRRIVIDPTAAPPG
jgi:predicted phosphoribosyltransferase